MVLINDFKEDLYTEYIIKKFDLQVEDKVETYIQDFPTEELETITWNIGLILGNSGSGKSTILRSLGEIKEPQYDNEKSIISQFPNLSPYEVTELLSGVGLSSVPIWLHKPNQISSGEKARLDIAWLIANATKNSILLIDEFTSVVNRPCALSLSFGIQKYIRKYRQDLKLILASCHFDIVEWIQPDWIFNLNKTENGKVNLEHLCYKDDYTSYTKVADNLILSEIKNVISE